MTADDRDLDRLAESVAFAHDPGVAVAQPSRERDELERVAALVTFALAGREPVPSPLRVRLSAAGLAYCATRNPGTRADAPRPPLAVVRDRSRGRWVAFACGLAAGALLWLGLGSGASTAPPGERRAALLAIGDTARLAWQAGPSPYAGAVAGDVVWSDAVQQGFLAFTGLRPLDEAHRYQLWIVDGDRNGPPVDGGLFAVEDATAETLVPIRPTLPIGRAVAFVVTVEAARGAVVSAQEHVVAVARN